jgi:hypothetical protein
MPATFRDIIVIMHEFSNINILIMVVGTLAGSMLILPILVHRLLRMFGISGSEHVSSGAMDASKAIAGYAALVISFCILEAQTNLHKAEDSISREASAILNLDRVLQRSEVPALVELRPALLAYGRAVVDQEWKLLAHPHQALHGAPEANATFTALSRGIFAFRPQGEFQAEMFREAISLSRQLVEVREERLANAELSLPSLFWATTALICVLLVVLACLVTPNAARRTELAGIGAAIGLLLALVVILDLPFSGESAAKPAPIERVMAYRFTPS